MAEPVQSSEEIADAASELVRAEMQPGRLFRLVGVGVAGFDHEEQPQHEQAYQLRLAGFE
jgi:hypothetical protein